MAKARGKGDRVMMDVLRKLSSSDHFYYMHDRSAWEGDAHRYFSPFDSPEEAYRSYLFALADLEDGEDEISVEGEIDVEKGPESD